MLDTLSSLATRWVLQFHYKTTGHSSFSLAVANHREQDEHTPRRKRIHPCPRSLASLICVTTRFDLQTSDHLPLLPHLSFWKVQSDPLVRVIGLCDANHSKLADPASFLKRKGNLIPTQVEETRTCMQRSSVPHGSEVFSSRTWPDMRMRLRGPTTPTARMWKVNLDSSSSRLVAQSNMPTTHH